MCGRFTIFSSEETIRRRFAVSLEDGTIRPRYNLSPTQMAPVITQETPTAVTLMRWGLVPHWAKDMKIGSRLINARSETIAEKPSFREAFKKRRCLVLTDGFYEWDELSGHKAPYFITVKGSQPFAFAGIYESWGDDGAGKELKTFSIVTTTPNDLIARIHHRMPIILPESKERDWLNPALTPEEATAMLVQYPAEGMEMCEVSTAVNSPAHDRPDIIIPVNGSHSQS